MQGAATTKPSIGDLLAKAKVMGQRYLKILKRFWWIPALTAGLGLLVGAWKGAHLTPSYVSEAQMVLSGQFNIEGTARVTEAGGDFLPSQFALITSKQVADRARARVLGQHPDWIAVPVSVNVSQIPRTSFLSLSASGLEPLYTQAFLDGVMQEYMTVRKEMRKEKSDNMTSAISSQLLVLEKKTNDDEQDVVNYQESNKISFVQSSHNSAAEYLGILERELASLKTELNILNTLNDEQKIDLSSQPLQAQKPQPVQSGTSANAKRDESNMSSFDSSFVNAGNAIMQYQAAKQTVHMLKVQREEMLKIARLENPRIKLIDDKILEAQQLMDSYKIQSMDVINMRRDALEIRIKSKQADIREWSTRAMDLSQKLAEYERLRLKVDHDHKQFDQLMATLQSIDIYKNVEQETLSILAFASPASPMKTSLGKIVFNGLLAGLFLGLTALFLIDKTDDRIVSFVEAKGNFKEYPILGQIPHDTSEGTLSLLVPYDPRRNLLDAFRSLRSSMLFAPVEGTRPKALMIASAMEGEGKTTIASNLAATLAFSGAKTLLIDCNLVDGKLHELFNTTPDRGLMNVLQQQIAWNEAVIQTDIDNLFLLPRGEALAYPAEHFFGAFLKDIYQEFDYIIFDSAAVLDNGDVLSFAPMVDGVLFVVRFGKTSAAKATEAMKHFTARQVNVLGLICNDV